jgi:hypothetical protein
MPNWPSAPVDGSGGYAELTVTDDIDAHRIRVHLHSFDASTLAYPSALGGEAGVNDTLQNFLNIIMRGYDSGWNAFCSALFQNNSGVLTPIYPLPTAAQSGSNGLAALVASDPARACRTTITMRTANPTGRTRYRLDLVAWGNHYTNASSPVHTTGNLPQVPVVYQGNSSGTNEQRIVAYVTGTNGLLAHDGHKPQGVAKLSTAENAVLKRRYGFN